MHYSVVTTHSTVFTWIVQCAVCTQGPGGLSCILTSPGYGEARAHHTAVPAHAGNQALQQAPQHFKRHYKHQSMLNDTTSTKACRATLQAPKYAVRHYKHQSMLYDTTSTKAYRATTAALAAPASAKAGGHRRGEGPFVALGERVARLLHPVPDGVGRDVVLLGEVGGADVLLQHLPHDPRPLLRREGGGADGAR